MSKPDAPTLAEARAAKSKAAALVSALPVVGIGIARIGDGHGLKVNLSERVAANAVPVVGTIRKR